MGDTLSNRHTNAFGSQSLMLDSAAEVERISKAIQEAVHHRFHRQGAVVGISGGIDSSVVLALCARALGPDRVLGLMLPEQDSSQESSELAKNLADGLGVKTVTEDITSVLDGFGCYQRRNEAVQRVFPQFEPGWAVKIVLPGSLLDQDTLNFFSLVVTDFQGAEYRKRLPPAEFLQIMAASNFKQRARMSMLYYYAELRNFCVVGTTNKNEYELGFFVKHGDAGVDINPISHLFKSQVYQLAHELSIPENIINRTPTTDTYPGGSTQEEFFYRIPYHLLDTIWFGFEKGIPNAEIAAALSLTTEQVQRVIDDIQRKQRTTQFLRTAPLTVEQVYS